MQVKRLPNGDLLRLVAGLTAVIAPIFLPELSRSDVTDPTALITPKDRIVEYVGWLILNIGLLVFSVVPHRYFVRSSQARVYGVLILTLPVMVACFAPFALDEFEIMSSIPVVLIGLLALACICHLFKLRDNNA